MRLPDRKHHTHVLLVMVNKTGVQISPKFTSRIASDIEQFNRAIIPNHASRYHPPGCEREIAKEGNNKDWADHWFIVSYSVNRDDS